ncbi:MAG: hypothetical protein N3G20_06840, partial [Verrucomicrobiae bacterium]|nr:hypothetical protein [Verrucomicrobiae bacterium]
GSGEIVNNLGFVEDRASAYADSPLTCSVFVNDVFYGLIRGLAGHVYRIEASTDFSDWVPIATGIASERGRLWFKDSEASGYTMRFYRAKPTGE